jgi:hypothetical protein
MMKKLLVLSLFLSPLLQLQAQETFGMASFTVPTGWQMTRASETVTLEKDSKKGMTCKIIISATEKGAVTTNAEYLQYRAKNGGAGVSYQNQRGAVTKYEANGLTSFFSKGTMTQNRKTVTSYFYSLSNGSQTLYYQLLTTNNECITEFNEFMTTLTMELEQAGQTNARARKAAPAAPAAPAPVM